MCDIPESYSPTHMQCNQPCERRKGKFGELYSGYAQVFSAPHSCFLPLGRAGHLPNLNMGVQRGTGTWPNRDEEILFFPPNVSLPCNQRTHTFSSSYILTCELRFSCSNAYQWYSVSYVHCNDKSMSHWAHVKIPHGIPFKAINFTFIFTTPP